MGNPSRSQQGRAFASSVSPTCRDPLAVAAVMVESPGLAPGKPAQLAVVESELAVLAASLGCSAADLEALVEADRGA